MTMKKDKMNALERNSSMFLLIGLAISLSFCLLAFKWKTYRQTENRVWISIDNSIDTLELPPSINIPQPKAFIPKTKKHNNFVKASEFSLNEAIKEEYENMMTKENQTTQKEFEDDFISEDYIEELDSLPFKPDITNPSVYPVLNTRRCQKYKSNKDQYLCSLEYIKNRIKNQLYTPDMLFEEIRFSVAFKIDTSGKVVNIKIVGTDDSLIKNSAKKILSNTPLFSPPILHGEKRVMKNHFGVIIKNE